MGGRETPTAVTLLIKGKLKCICYLWMQSWRVRLVPLQQILDLILYLFKVIHISYSNFQKKRKESIRTLIIARIQQI